MQTRFTPPVQSILALNAALNELSFEGTENRLKRYYSNWKYLIQEMKKLGFRVHTPEEYASWIVTCFYDYDHPKFNFMEMYQYLKDKGFVIYPGKMGDNTFRIANIGDIGLSEIKSFLDIVKSYIKTLS
jgi:2-aminoethylphosphonate-pyruvate transaminase